jgi:hypothetical protein
MMEFGIHPRATGFHDSDLASAGPQSKNRTAILSDNHKFNAGLSNIRRVIAGHVGELLLKAHILQSAITISYALRKLQ